MNFADYPRWNPFVKSIAGNAVVGQSLDVCIQPPGSRGVRFHPKVLVVEANHEFRWKGKLLVNGLFDGEHYFSLNGNRNTVVLTHGEIFSGLLVPLIRGSLEGKTKQGFIAMNDALKREAERT